MNPLQQLKNHGQSFWLDNLNREMLVNGKLEKMVKEDGLTGITSNPTIFNKAISASDLYDQQIENLADLNYSEYEIYKKLVVQDVQEACDILRSVYDTTDGRDGYVSLEVSPHLAHHTEATEQEALELFELVDRPNVLIKIPGTEEGIPAIEHMLFRGVNVNITLLFSIDMYEAVIKAYIRAIEDRILRKMPVNHITSVASFFLSRIDVLVDQLLSQRITPAETVMNGIDITSLMGKATVANAKMAYQKFKRYFSGAKWSDLTRKGARVQRLLWASTSTKNPEYSDVMYIEPLIGEDTVTTMPEQTLSAFADHGKVEADIIDQDVDRVSALFRDLNTVGIDMDFVTRQLVNEGIQKFIDPFDHLMQTIKNRRQKLVMAKNNDLIE